MNIPFIQADAIPVHYRVTLGQNGQITTGVQTGATGPSTLILCVNDQVAVIEGVDLAAGAGAGTGGGGPVTEALIIDVQRSAGRGNTFASLYGGNQALMPTIQPGAPKGSSGQPSVPIINSGDQLRFNVIQADGVAQNVLMTIKGLAMVD